MNKSTVRSQHQDNELVNDYKRSKSPELRSKIIETYSPYIHHIAYRLIVPEFAVVDRRDLFQCGVIGLLEALENFDPSRDVQFKSFAYPRIRGEMLDMLQREGCLDKKTRECLSKIEKTTVYLQHAIGREPTVEEVCKHINISPGEFHRVSGTAGLIYAARNAEKNVLQFIQSEDTEQPDEAYVKKSLRKLVADCIRKLPERESLILSLYFVEELTLLQIGEVLSLSEARISQVLNKTLLDIRLYIESMESFSLEEENHDNRCTL